jgi:flagellar motor switch protein FliM
METFPITFVLTIIPVQDIDELLKVIKEGIEQEKKEAIRQLTHQYDPTKLEKEHVKESRSIIDKDLERLFKRPE